MFPPVDKVWGQDQLVLEKSGVEIHKLILRDCPETGNPVRCSVHKHVVKYNMFMPIKGQIGLHWIDMNGKDCARVVSEGETFTLDPGTVHHFFTCGDAEVLEFVWAEKLYPDIERLSEGCVISEEMLK